MDSSHDKNLVDYVQRELSLRTSTDTIIRNMAAAGWQTDEVQKIIAEFQDSKSALNKSIASVEHPRKHHHIVRIIVWSLTAIICAFLITAYIVGGD